MVSFWTTENHNYERSCMITCALSGVVANRAGLRNIVGGEVHEYENGPSRSMLFRVRYGTDMRAHHCAWRGNSEWTQSAEDADYYRKHPVG